MRLVCNQLRAAIDVSVSGLNIASSDSDDPDEVLQRLARTSLRPSKLYLWNYSSTQTTLFLAALAAREVVPVLHGVQHLTLSSIMPLSAALSPTELPALETALETPQQSSRDASTWGQKRPRTCLGRGALQQLSMDQQQLQGAQHQLALDQQQLQGAKRQLTLDQEQLQGAQHQLALDQQQLQGAKRQLTLDQEQLQGAQHQLALDQQQLQGAKRQLTLDQEQLQGAQHQLALEQKQLQGAKRQLTLDQEQLQGAQHQLALDLEQLQGAHKQLAQDLEQLQDGITGLERSELLLRQQQQHMDAWIRGSVQRRWCLVLKDEEVEKCAEPDPDAHRLLRTISGSRAMHAMFFPADGVAPMWSETACACVRHMGSKPQQCMCHRASTLSSIPMFGRVTLASDKEEDAECLKLLHARAPHIASSYMTLTMHLLKEYARGCLGWKGKRLTQKKPLLRADILEHLRWEQEMEEDQLAEVGDDEANDMAMRLVCKQLRAAIDDAVNSLDIALNDSDDPDEVLQRLARTSLRPSELYLEHHPGIMCRAWQRLPHLSSLTLRLTAASGAAAATPGLKGLEHITSLRSLDLNFTTDMVDEGSLSACTQLTALCGCRWFPALTQLTQLQHLEDVQDLSSNSLPLLATLPQLADLRLNSCPLQPSSQLSRFLFQHLTSLTVDSILSRDLAALDCPQLQTLTLSELLVDSAANLRACASGILQHCSSIYKLLTMAGSSRQQQLVLGSCHLLPGALSSVATRLTQLTCLDLYTSPVALVELQLLAAMAKQGASLRVLPQDRPGPGPGHILHLTPTATLSDACDALSGAAATQLPSLGAHELAVLVEGLSRCQLQGVDSRLLAALGHAAVPHVLAGAFSPGGLASLLAGFARARQCHAPLGNAAAWVAALQVEAFTCPQLATLLWAMSVMRVVDRQLVERVAELLLQGPLAGPGWVQEPRSSLDSCDDLLPRSSAASLLQQLGWVEGDEEDEDGEWAEPLSAGPCRPHSASFTWVLLAWAFARTRYHHHQLYDKLGEAVLQGLQGSHLMPRLQQASRAAPPHPSSSSSSVAATHSRSGHGTRSSSPLSGLPLSLPAPPPSPASPLPSTPLARGPPQPSPLPTPLAQRSSTCLVQLLWAFASHEHCQAALLRAAAPVLSARIL
ncbi:hypothetical protein QJQ45_000264 [Haematococcus lacustris]|nr:hypothetical protein QJQ45_000264 [Haematococcus lacustris]